MERLTTLSTGSDIQRQLYKALVEAYEADKILLDTYGDTTEGPKEEGQKGNPSTVLQVNTPRQAEKTTKTGSKTHKKSASQSAPVGEAMHSTDVFKGPADQEFETGVQDEQAEEEVQHPSYRFSKTLRDYLPPDHKPGIRSVPSCRS
ncbi:hypothetical protein Tco_0079410 [Tanacetum coccineum]